MCAMYDLKIDRLRRGIAITSFLFLSLLITAPQAISQPCAVPPTSGGVTVLPNVLVIFDNSGSMLEDAHRGSYSRTTTYEGMFDTNGRYSYNSTDGYFYENSSGEWSGNFLNWISMTKVDLARQVLTGGKMYNEGGNNYLVSNTEIRDKGQWGFNDDASPYQTAYHGQFSYLHVGYIGSEWSGFRVYDSTSTLLATYNIKLLLPTGYTAEGLLHSIQDEVRLGLMHFNNTEGGFIEHDSDGKYLKKLDSAHLATIVAKLNRDLGDDYSSTWTPLAETLYEATRFFAQVGPYYSSSDYTTDVGGANDPLYNEDYNDTVWCAKNYVLLLTDGNSTEDLNIPTELQDYYNDGLGCTPDPNPCACDPDFSCSGSYGSNGSAYLDDIAYYAHTTDLRPASGGSRALQGDQNITLHDVYLFGVAGKADVLLNKAAQRGGGIYKRAENASEIVTALEDIFAVITGRAASAASVAITSETVSGDDTDLIYIPYYKNPEESEWWGNIRAFRLGSSGYLLAGDTGGTPAIDENNDQVLDGPKWDAATELAALGADNREIFTHISGTGSLVAFNSANATTIGAYFDADLDGDSTEDTSIDASALISYIRGNDTPTGFSTGTLRARDPYYLGDIMHAGPVFVGKPATRYDLIYGDMGYWDFYWENEGRTPVLYAPANDGMLHCLDALSGQEKWAFIPYNLLSHLKWLADPNYCHCYYVDLTADVWDIEVGGEWKSVLVGGMRLGGTPDGVDTDNDGTDGDETLRSALFTLDVTDPTVPSVLWEINDDTYGRFGYTTSRPVPVRVANGGTTKWFLVFGSGPKTRDGAGGDTSDGYSVTDGSIFVVDVETGNTTAIDVGAWSTGNFFGSPVAIDYDTDYKVDLIYIGDAKGNLWRIKTFTISGGVKSYATAPTDWAIDVSGNASATNPQPLLSLGPDQPILVKPAVAMDEWERVWIFLGTGRYFCANDNDYCGENGNECPDGTSGSCSVTDGGMAYTRSKYMAVGVYDRYFDDGAVQFVLQSSTLDKDDLDHRIIIEGTVAGSGEAGYYVVDAGDGEIHTNVTSNGWYYHLLESKERCLGDFTLYNATVYYLTFIPDTSDPCARGGLSNMYGVYYTSGTSLSVSAMDLTGEGDIDDDDLVEDGDDKYGGAILKLPRGFAGGGIKVRECEDGTTKAYTPLPNNPPITIRNRGTGSGPGVTTWREVFE